MPIRKVAIKIQHTKERKFIKSLNFSVTMGLSSTGAQCLTSATTFGWGQFKPAQASLVQFSAHDKQEQHGLSCHFRFRTLTKQMCCWIVDLNYNIIVNLCSKLHYEVLLKSGNHIVYILRWTSDLDFNMGGCIIQI